MNRTPEVERVLESIDAQRLVAIVRNVCRIPSVLGDEAALATYLCEVMSNSGFSGVAEQPVLPQRPNAIGELVFGEGPRVVFTGHMDTKPASI